MDEIERQTRKAMDRHDRLLHLKNMELLLGAMVQRSGVSEVRILLQRYLDDLAEFDPKGDAGPQAR